MVRVRLNVERHQVVAEIEGDGTWREAMTATDRGRGIDTIVRLGIDIAST